MNDRQREFEARRRELLTQAEPDVVASTPASTVTKPVEERPELRPNSFLDQEGVDVVRGLENGEFLPNASQEKRDQVAGFLRGMSRLDEVEEMRDSFRQQNGSDEFTPEQRVQLAKKVDEINEEVDQNIAAFEGRNDTLQTQNEGGGVSPKTQDEGSGFQQKEFIRTLRENSVNLGLTIAGGEDNEDEEDESESACNAIMSALENELEAYGLFYGCGVKNTRDYLRDTAAVTHAALPHEGWRVLWAEAAWMHPAKKLLLWVTSASMNGFVLMSLVAVPLLTGLLRANTDGRFATLVCLVLAFAGWVFLYIGGVLLLFMLVKLLLEQNEPNLFFEVEGPLRNSKTKSLAWWVDVHRVFTRAVHSYRCVFTVLGSSLFFTALLLPLDAWNWGIVLLLTVPVYVVLNAMSIGADKLLWQYVLPKLERKRGLVLVAKYSYEPFAPATRYRAGRQRVSFAYKVDEQWRFLVFRRAMFRNAINVRAISQRAGGGMA